jgi:hypothetical protein
LVFLYVPITTPSSNSQLFLRLNSFRYPPRTDYLFERQALAEADRTEIEERMQFTRDNYRLMRERLPKSSTGNPKMAASHLPIVM